MQACTSGKLPGVLVALDQRNGYGPPQQGPYEAQVVTIQPEKGARVLVSGLPVPSPGVPAVSPDGRFIAFGRAMDRGPGNQNRPDLQGLWLMQRDGSSLHRLLTPPPSAAGNFLAIGPLAWSADSKTLAYSVQTLGSGVRCPDPAVGGIWLTSIAQPQPHRVASAAQLGLLQPLPSGQPGCPLSISRLSWSPDGKRLAVSAYRLKAAATQPGDLEPVILAVNVGSGSARPLVIGGANGVFAPRSGQVAYTTLVYPTAATPAVTTIWVADPNGQHGRKVGTVPGSIFELVWAPNGRFLAFLNVPTGPSQGPSLQMVGFDGVGCTLLTSVQLQQPPLLSGGSLSGLAWLPTGA